MLSTKNQKVFEGLVKAIDESKRPFKDLPQSAIYSYLKSGGVEKSAYGSIYDELVRYYNPVKIVQKEVKSAVSQVTNKNATVYSQDPKERTPRKSVFGQIVKV